MAVSRWDAINILEDVAREADLPWFTQAVKNVVSREHEREAGTVVVGVELHHMQRLQAEYQELAAAMAGLASQAVQVRAEVLKGFADELQAITAKLEVRP